ncbi:MAG: glycosyltransferase family 2 protein, partial [Odoribacter sp.]|nr:glycosyltransferase family 2 protein [Odoribacter sp.]
DISVTIVAYNNYGDITRSVCTLEKYTSNKLRKKIYIVDNSGDNYDHHISRDTMKSKILKYKDVEYINTGSNLGFGRGNNFIIPLLDSHYHAMVNPDIVFVDDTLTKLVEYMEQNPDVGMCIPRIIDADGNLQPVYRRELTIADILVRYLCPGLCKNKFKMHTMQDMDYSKPFQVPFGQGSFLVIRTDLFQKLGGFDEHFFMYVEDADLCKRVNQVSKLMYFPDASVILKWERSSHKNMKLFFEHLKSIAQYFVKWGIIEKMKSGDNDTLRNQIGGVLSPNTVSFSRLSCCRI